MTDFTAQDYLTLGAGGVSFMLLIGIVVFAITKLLPLLQKIFMKFEFLNNAMDDVKDAITDLKVENSNSKQATENNTKAVENTTKDIDKLAESNGSIAKSIELQGQSVSMLAQLMEKQFDKSTSIETTLIRIDERTKN